MKNKVSVSLICLAIILIISVIFSGCGGDMATTEDKTANAPKSPSELVIGKWISGGDSLEFKQKGT